MQQGCAAASASPRVLATTAERDQRRTKLGRKLSHCDRQGTSESWMKHLSSPEGQDALRGLSLARSLFAFDFDGTLAPIVTRPDAARLSIGVQQQLAQLA